MNAERLKNKASNAKKTVLALLVLGLGACGKAPSVLDIDPEFASYVQAFSDVGSVKINSLVVKFGKMQNGRQNALCYLSPSEPPTIVVSASLWAGYNDSKRESVLFHELGHCVLGRVHSDTVDQSGHPLSLMHSSAIATETYETFRDYYLQELFAQ